MTLLRTLRFDQAFDGRSWPDPLAAMEAEAVFGRAHVGPKRLLALLELQLGLGGPAASHIERVAALVPILVARLATGDALDPPFYAKSFEVDALGTAERLLQLRDRLALAGFDGSPQHCVSPRLQTLAEATAERLPGVAERLQRIMRTLPGRTLDIGVIEPLRGGKRPALALATSLRAPRRAGCERPDARPARWRAGRRRSRRRARGPRRFDRLRRAR